ncbi:MAG: formyltransferase family protein [Ferruginibacter sp.]
MLKKLQAHWKVNGINLVLIITTFALGGSLCGYAGRKILLLTNLEKGAAWIVLYILLITLLWPVCVILISLPLGQFAFFKRYLGKVWKKMSGKRADKTKEQDIVRIAIFASGAGSNAEKIITSPPAPLLKERDEAKTEANKETSPPSPLLEERGDAKTETSPPSPLLEERGDANTEANKRGYTVALIVCNKPGAGVLTIAEKNNIPALLIEKERFFYGDNYLPELQKHKIDFIVLAGFLWKIPIPVIKAYPKKIINIHPALLPKYGGKGMYGNKVHQAVIAAKENESGISVHYVDELYDHGEIIFQGKCPVTANDTAESLAQKIHVLEHAHYPRLIADLIQKQNRS